MPAPRGRARRRRSRTWVWASIGGLALVVAVAAVVVTSIGRSDSGPAHVLVMPPTIGSYVRRPQLEQQSNAQQLQREVVAGSAGQASRVVSAVYENNSGVSGGATPQMILFVGGNLSGVSASGYIASFVSQFKGAKKTSAGSMGGLAACVNAQPSALGAFALCTWADNNTFGVVASPTMDPARLATQMRMIRPDIEHVAK